MSNLIGRRNPWVTDEMELGLAKNPDFEKLHENWGELSLDERVTEFQALPPGEAQEFFRELSAREESEILLSLPERERTLWIRVLAPDDAADVIQESPPEDHPRLLSLLDEQTRNEVSGLLAYAEDVAGGLMNPRYGRIRPDMTVAEALAYLKRQDLERERTVYYVYVLDEEQHLLGVVSLRRLFFAQPAERISKFMRTNVVKVSDTDDQEEIGRRFAEHNLIAVPVVDENNRMKGIVTVDDIVDVIEEEATEDIQKLGGTEVLEGPYLQVALREMIRKRAGWLVILFVGEMLTANAMGYFEGEIAHAVVLALFVPLIISSGGNAGSQASTLVVRAMALGDVRLMDWWRVCKRELVVGLALGCILALVGFARIVLWQFAFHTYGQHYLLIAATVAISLIGIVMWGSLSGSILPMILRKVGFDPAAASTPFVATLVDVTGLVIYFNVARLILTGTIL